MTTHSKVAITLPTPLLEKAREEVRCKRAPSLSALIAEALEEKLGGGSLQDLLDQWAEEDGPLTPEEIAWADRILDG